MTANRATTDSSGKLKRKTYKTIESKTVYGGGGFRRSLYRLDTSLFTQGAPLIARGTINRFAYHYYLQNLATLKNFPSVSVFHAGFSFSETDWKNFSVAAAADSIKADPFPRLKNRHPEPGQVGPGPAIVEK
ncbi:MAG: hypothetical protein IPI66_08540 [Chitinophagaceae bacterium]|nr:hypothetical protein [Chitinophagaceae bacterium]